MNIYLTFKALHLIAVISWMAGLLYLPRIFVYHTENQDEKQINKVFIRYRYKSLITIYLKLNQLFSS